jgi:hypothetical protein
LILKRNLKLVGPELACWMTSSTCLQVLYLLVGKRFRYCEIAVVATSEVRGKL